MPDPPYVVARTVLLDALEALDDQRGAIIVVGAQAIDLHTGTIELAVPEFTIDADLTLDPSLLRDAPETSQPCVRRGSSVEIESAHGWSSVTSPA